MDQRTLLSNTGKIALFSSSSSVFLWEEGRNISLSFLGIHVTAVQSNPSFLSEDICVFFNFSGMSAVLFQFCKASVYWEGSAFVVEVGLKSTDALDCRSLLSFLVHAVILLAFVRSCSAGNWAVKICLINALQVLTNRYWEFNKVTGFC